MILLFRWSTNISISQNWILLPHKSLGTSFQITYIFNAPRETLYFKFNTKLTQFIPAKDTYLEIISFKLKVL